MLIGFKTCHINSFGLPTNKFTGYKAQCFFLFGECLWVGKLFEAEKK